MKKIGLFGITIFFSLLVMAQKQINDPNAEVRSVSGYHAIKVSTGIKLYLTQSNTEAVAVSATVAEYRDKIITRVENGVLKIYIDQSALKWWKNFTSKGKRPIAYVSVVTLDKLDLSSGSSVETDGVLSGDKLSLDASSGALFNGEVRYNSISADQSSGSVVKITGTAGSLHVDGSSGSVFEGYGLAVDNCDADVSSGAGVHVTMTKEMSAEASSGGFIGYKGSGVIRKVRTSSGGSVSKKG